MTPIVEAVPEEATAPEGDGGPTRSRLLVAAAVVLVLLVSGIGGFALLTEGFRTTDEYTNTLAAQTAQLTVDNEAGSVLLQPSTDALVHVYARAQHGAHEPRLTAESGIEGVTVGAECDDDLADCSVDYLVQVPPAFAIRVRAESGQVSASDLTGRLEVVVDSGDIRLDDLSGPLELHSGSGVVEAHGLRSSTVRVDSDAGDVDMELVAVPDVVEVRSGSGDLGIVVPGTGQYRLAVDSGDGSTAVGVAMDDTSTHSISASTGHGDVTVLPTGRAPKLVPFEDGPRPPDAPVPPRAVPVPRPVPDLGG